MRDYLTVLRLKITQYEFWPFWLFFLPVAPYYLFYALKLRSFTYFTAVNPGIEFGGFFGEEKSEIISNISTKYLPKYKLFMNLDLEQALLFMRSESLDFPIIVKPNVGERGDQVRKIKNERELIEHIETVNYPVIIQEFVAFELELGVLYSRMPNSTKGRVTSITGKNFLKVVGDGEKSVLELLKSNPRALIQMKRLKTQRPLLLKQIPKANEVVLVEPIGNHCLGTEFKCFNHLISKQLSEVFDQISMDFKGFYYGRYDLRVRSVEDMINGQGIYIFELNGVTSEPSHIYDTNYTLIKAYKDVIEHQRIVYEIAKENIKNGFELPKTSEIVTRARTHFFGNKR